MQDGVAAIIFDNHREKILLIKRNDIPIWVLPSGGIDEEETPEEAVIRESYEETGYHVKIKRKVAEYLAKGRFTADCHLYECEIIGGKISLSDETSDIDFYNITSEFPHPFFPLHKEWILDCLEGHQTIMKKTVNITLWFIIKALFTHPYLSGKYLFNRSLCYLNSLLTRYAR